MKKALIVTGLVILAGILARMYTQQTKNNSPSDNDTAPAPDIMQIMCEKNGRIWNKDAEKCEAAPSEE